MMLTNDLPFENSRRQLLHGYIREHPGSTFQMLMRVMDLPEGTLRYHLNYLERKKKVVNEKRNGKLHYYSTIVTTERNEDGLKLSKAQELVLEMITNGPGITRKELLIRTRASENELDHTLRKLRENKLIWKRENIRGSGYERITKEGVKEEVYKLLVVKLMKEEISFDEFKDLKTRLINL